MQVSQNTPINSTERPFLAKWDTAARHYFAFFEASKIVASDNLKSLQANPFTNWRNTIQLRDRYNAVDSLTLRQ